MGIPPQPLAQLVTEVNSMIMDVDHRNKYPTCSLTIVSCVRVRSTSLSAKFEVVSLGLVDLASAVSP